MKIQFQYAIQKDIENYQKASQSTNNKKPTRMQALYIAEYGTGFEDQKLQAFITKYIATDKLSLSDETERIENAWRPLEQEFLKRLEVMFGIKSLLDTIRVFLTTDTRCSYNLEHGYFFVSVSRPFQNKTIMHELLHFWTWWRFHTEVDSGNMTEESYNDAKESLTELLNIEFQDLLEGAHDDGYPQHKEMRAVVGQTWSETKDIRKVFEIISKLCPIDKPNSPL